MTDRFDEAANKIVRDKGGVCLVPRKGIAGISSHEKTFCDCEVEKILAAALRQSQRQKDRCPCGGIILADTEDCRTPLCPNCAEENSKAVGQRQMPSEDDRVKANDELAFDIVQQLLPNQDTGECVVAHCDILRILNRDPRLRTRLESNGEGEK